MGSKIKRKAALVLSGGGAKGAFQVGAEKYAREMKNYEWDVISGVSVGALNGAMIAMGKYQELFNVWYTISTVKVMTGKLNLWSILKMAFGAKSIYSNHPLWKLIDEKVDVNQIMVDFMVGVVSLETGAYKPIKISPSTSARMDKTAFKKAILASTAIPIIWEPVDISTSHRSMVDGGLRNMSPIGDAFQRLRVPDVEQCSWGPGSRSQCAMDYLEFGDALADVAPQRIVLPHHGFRDLPEPGSVGLAQQADEEGARGVYLPEAMAQKPVVLRILRLPIPPGVNINQLNTVPAQSVP